MLDHIKIRVVNLAKSKAFYKKSLAPLGLKIVLGSAKESYWGFGLNKDPFFEIQQSDKKHLAHTNVHLAFKVKDKKTVKAFYGAALDAGGKDNGAPGRCPEYTEKYYAAFVFDFDGNNIEVCIY